MESIPIPFMLNNMSVILCLCTEQLYMGGREKERRRRERGKKAEQECEEGRKNETQTNTHTHTNIHREKTDRY
jgi:hypothetical protein